MNDSLTKLIDKLRESGDVIDRFQAEESRKRFEALPEPEPVDEFAPFDILPPEAQAQRSYTDMYRQRAVDAAIQRGASTEEIAAMGRGEWKPPEVGKPQEWLVSPVGSPNEVNENTPIPIDEFARMYYEQNNAPSVLTRNIAGLTAKEQGEYYREQPVWEARIKEAYNTQYGAGAYDEAIKRAIPRKAGELTGFGVGAGTIASKALEPSQGLGAVTPLDIAFAAADVAGAAGAAKAAIPVIKKGAQALSPLARELATSEAGFARIPGKAPKAGPIRISEDAYKKGNLTFYREQAGAKQSIMARDAEGNIVGDEIVLFRSDSPVIEIMNASSVSEYTQDAMDIIHQISKETGKVIVNGQTRGTNQYKLIDKLINSQRPPKIEPSAPKVEQPLNMPPKAPPEPLKVRAKRISNTEQVALAHDHLTDKLVGAGVDEDIAREILEQTYRIPRNPNKLSASLGYERLRTTLQDSALQDNAVEDTTRRILARKLGVETHEVDQVLAMGPYTPLGKEELVKSSIQEAKKILQVIKGNLPTMADIRARSAMPRPTRKFLSAPEETSVELSPESLNIPPASSQRPPKIEPSAPKVEQPLNMPPKAPPEPLVEGAGMKPPGKPPKAPVNLSGGQGASRPIDNIIAQSAEQVRLDRPGLITNLAQKIPGLKQLAQFERPGLKMAGENEKLLTSYVAEGAARSDVAARTMSSRYPTFNKLKQAFGEDALAGKKTKVEFIGTPEQAKNPITGTLKDIADNPELYNLTDAQKTVLAELDARNTNLLNHVVEGYGADVNKYPAKPEGAFLPNVDISEDVIRNLSESKAVATGRGKTRIYETARDRMAADKTFKPELNVQKLIEGMDSFKASAAGGQTFRQSVGGLTRLEAMQETHPALANKMLALKKRLVSLQGTAGRLDEKVHTALNDFLNSSTIEGTDLSNLQNSLDVKLSRGPNVGKNIADIQKEIDGIRAQIKALKPAWENANLKPYKFVQEGIYRYFPADQAVLISELRETTNNPLLNAIENVRGTAFSGDLSPILGVQTPVGILADPIGSLGVAKGALAKSLSEKNILRPFQLDALAADISKAPDSWATFFAYMGRPPAGTPQEFAGGFLQKLPGFNKFTESTYIVVTRQAKALYDRTAESLIKSGVSRLEAQAAAAAKASEVYPFLNPRRLGQSQARAAVLRALPTSYSFIRQPATLIADAVKGYAKLGTFQRVTPKEKLSMKIVTTLAASTLSVSAISAAIDAKRNNRDVGKAVLDAINPDPRNGKFASLILGDVRIPIGGPYRAIFRAIYPQNVEGIPFPVPFAGIPNYIQGRMNPLFRTQKDLLVNQDFYGFTIRKGTFIQQLLQSLEYEVEGLIPLTAGSFLEGQRTGATPSDTLTQVGGQFAGVNVQPINPVPALRDEYSQKDFGKPYSQLNRAEIDELNKNHPDLITLQEKNNARYPQDETETAVKTVIQAAVKQRNDSLNTAAQALQSGQITKEQYDKQRAYTRPYYSGAMNALYQLRDNVDPETAAKITQIYQQNAQPEDLALDAYQEKYRSLIDNAPLPVDWDKIDAGMNKFLAGYDPKIKQYVLDHKDDWIKDLPEPARTIEMQRLKGIKDESWWDDYRGVSKPVTPRTTTPKKRTLDDYLNNVNSGATSRIKTIDDYLQAVGR